MTSDTRLFSFVGGNTGHWRVDEIHCLAGSPIPVVSRVSVLSGSLTRPREEAPWILRGIRSNERYVARDEKSALTARQEDLGRGTSTRAALIPIRKNAVWWALAQDERRQIFEAQSHHIGTGLKYLPAVARRLFHCRDLGPEEPFDFLTWFEYSPDDAETFDELLRALRSSPEWQFVDREVDIRLAHE